jgi:pre-mRNA-processing factor 40
MHEELVQRAADEARRAERKRRHRMDDFRYALKKVQRIDIEMTYEEVCPPNISVMFGTDDQAEPFMKDIPEYEEMTPEDRRAAYEKFVKRQQEKIREEMEEGTSERKSSRMDIDAPEEKGDRRSKDKERERDHGSKRDSYSHSHKERDGDRHRRESDRKKKYSEEPDERDRDKKRARRDSVVSIAKSRSESISNSKRDDDVEEGEI